MPDPARQESPPPSGASLFPLIAGFMASQVIYVAARLGLAVTSLTGRRAATSSPGRPGRMHRRCAGCCVA